MAGRGALEGITSHTSKNAGVRASSPEAPQLDRLAGRSARLWVLSTVVLAACIVGAGLLVFGGDLLPEALRGNDAASYIAAGLILALGITFVFYSIEKEQSLRDLASRLVAERDRSADLSQLDEVRRDALAATCHDLKTPLTTIVGAAKTLIAHGETLDLDTRREFTESIQRQSLNMLQMIQSVLQTTQMEDAEPASMRREEIDLRHLVETLIFDIETGEFGAGHKLISHMEPAEPKMWGDPTAVLQIVTNLTENAIKYGADPIDISVEEGERQVVIAVADRGPGIPKEKLATIFDRFKRLDGTPGEGFGLGLYIVGNLVEAQGGTIEVASKPGKTRFTVRFPKRSDRTVDITD